MASLLVIIELVDDRPRPASLEVLGQARRIGSALGGTVYAMAACARAPGFSDDDLIAVLSRGGADKILLATAEVHGLPLRWGTHGAAVLSACQLVHPALILLADAPGARDLGGRVASRLGAAAVAEAFIELGPAGLAVWRGVGSEALPLDGDDDFAVLALVPPGRYKPAFGDEEAEVEVLEPTAPERDFEPVGEAVPWPTIAVDGAGEVAEQLAWALGGSVGGVPAPDLVIALGEPGLGPLGGACRVALGASAESTSHYAVEGDGPGIGRALAAALTAPATTALEADAR